MSANSIIDHQVQFQSPDKPDPFLILKRRAGGWMIGVSTVEGAKTLQRIMRVTDNARGTGTCRTESGTKNSK